MARFLNPSSWASLVPLGIGQVKPHHLREMADVMWENRDELSYAWRILRDGVCDGCALGTTGMRDFTMDGIHLCTVRLRLLRLNTMGALDHDRLADVSELAELSPRALRDLGRLGYPMVRHRGEAGFTRVSWDAALDLVADRVRPVDPRRLAFYLTSRGITNEVYYVAQKVARFLGTNHIDNSARVCHAPSTTALKRSIGYAASTCSYKDWLASDLVVFFGSDVANNQPVSTKYLYYARKNGTKVAMVNPFREPGLDRYWVPSVPESALFGTRLTDHYYQIHHGGDIAFLNGVLKGVIENNAVDEEFIAAHTQGFEELRTALDQQSWESLEESAGVDQAAMREFAQVVSEAKSAVFVWSMGITQHRFGVDNVHAIINLALARGFLGREGCGLMPIRGHSGVQGGAEVGCVPWSLPGGVPVDEENTRRFGEMWGFEVPSWKGMSAVDTVDAAHRGELDLLWAVGGDYLKTLPEPEYCREALERVPVRVHQDIVLTHQMFVDAEEVVVLLPGRTRYEQPGGGTETATERRIYFSPEIPGRRVGESRSEWEILMDFAQRVHPERSHQIHFDSGQAVRDEIARAVPFYDGIQHLRVKGDAMQWGGARLCEGGVCNTVDGRGVFRAIEPPTTPPEKGWYWLSTRRGKQFNSMIQMERDPLTGAARDAVLMAREDVRSLGLVDDDPVTLRSTVGVFEGRCMVSDIRPGNVQVHWPEGNVLLARGVVEPESGIPDYNAQVQVEAGWTEGSG